MNGIDGKRETYRCPACRKKFTFWRPEALPGVKVKCYWCNAEFEDDAAKRPPATPAAPPAPPPALAPESPSSPAA